MKQEDKEKALRYAEIIHTDNITNQGRRFNQEIEGYYFKSVPTTSTIHPFQYYAWYEGDIYTTGEFIRKFVPKLPFTNLVKFYILSNRPPMEVIVNYNARHTPIHEPKRCPYTYEDLKIYKLICTRRQKYEKKIAEREKILHDVAYGKMSIQKGKII